MTNPCYAFEVPLNMQHLILISIHTHTHTSYDEMDSNIHSRTSSVYTLVDNRMMDLLLYPQYTMPFRSIAYILSHLSSLSPDRICIYVCACACECVSVCLSDLGRHFGLSFAVFHDSVPVSHLAAFRTF